MAKALGRQKSQPDRIPQAAQAAVREVPVGPAHLSPSAWYDGKPMAPKLRSPHHEKCR